MRILAPESVFRHYMLDAKKRNANRRRMNAVHRRTQHLRAGYGRRSAEPWRNRSLHVLFHL